MPSHSNATITILMVDDDADDRYLTKTAFEENDIRCELQFIDDGSEVFDFLNRKGTYEDVEGDLPNLILLDLNMPKKSGQQVLKEIKKSPLYQHIPIVIFTTSKAPTEVRNLYSDGASSFVTKPTSFDKLLEVTRSIGQYWIETATLPQ